MSIITGKGTFRVDGTPRYFAFDENTHRGIAFDTRQARDAFVASVHVIVRGADNDDPHQMGSLRSKTASYGDSYENIVWDASEGDNVTDYEDKYNKLVAALNAEAKKRNWCAEWDTFRDQHGIPKTKPEYPAEPKDHGVVIKFNGEVPTYRRKDGKWLYTTTDGEYTWEELIDRRRELYGFAATEFKVLHP